MQLGCTHPKIPVEISNPVVQAYGYEKDSACKASTCSLIKTSKILLNIDSHLNQITYHLEKELEGKNKVKMTSNGKLTNCNIISKHDFTCDEFNMEDDRIVKTISIDYQTHQPQKINAPFDQYEFFSQSYTSEILAYTGILSTYNANNFNNDTYTFIIIAFIVFAAFSWLENQ